MKQTYTLYHGTPRTIADLAYSEQLWQHQRDYYTKVAEVKATSLEDVFHITNEDNWWDSPGVRVFTTQPLRLTMVGDVIVQGNEAWLVNAFGFEALPV